MMPVINSCSKSISSRPIAPLGFIIRIPLLIHELAENITDLYFDDQSVRISSVLRVLASHDFINRGYGWEPDSDEEDNDRQSASYREESGTSRLQKVLVRELPVLEGLGQGQAMVPVELVKGHGRL